MLLEIISPDSNLYSGEADDLLLPGSDGLFGVLNNHAAMISTLKKGIVRVRQAGKETEIPVNGGVVEILNNKVIILAEG